MALRPTLLSLVLQLWLATWSVAMPPPIASDMTPQPLNISSLHQSSSFHPGAQCSVTPLDFDARIYKVMGQQMLRAQDFWVAVVQATVDVALMDYDRPIKNWQFKGATPTLVEFDSTTPGVFHPSSIIWTFQSLAKILRPHGIYPMAYFSARKGNRVLGRGAIGSKGRFSKRSTPPPQIDTYPKIGKDHYLLPPTIPQPPDPHALSPRTGPEGSYSIKATYLSPTNLPVQDINFAILSYIACLAPLPGTVWFDARFASRNPSTGIIIDVRPGDSPPPHVAGVMHALGAVSQWMFHQQAYRPVGFDLFQWTMGLEIKVARGKITRGD